MSEKQGDYKQVQAEVKRGLLGAALCADKANKDRILQNKQARKTAAFSCTLSSV